MNHARIPNIYLESSYFILEDNHKDGLIIENVCGSRETTVCVVCAQIRLS